MACKLLTEPVIGSEPVGKKVRLAPIMRLNAGTHQVAGAAAEIMVPTCIELGGKDPAFILPSANLEAIASILLRGVLYVGLMVYQLTKLRA